MNFSFIILIEDRISYNYEGFYLMKQMTKNERRILTLLLQHKQLSKTEIAKRGEMSWSTAVKMIDRLLQRGYLQPAGKAINTQKRGKKEQLYIYGPLIPIAIGVDVEYLYSHIVLMSLNNSILAEVQVKTPQNPSIADVVQFLEIEISKFINDYVTNYAIIEGIGIGLPGVVIPGWIKPDINRNRDQLIEHLHALFKKRVVIEINVRSYANYMKWYTHQFVHSDFILISIRTGIGMGIIMNGKLFVGHQNISGELGHMKVVDTNPSICRCGSYGCLETVVNQNIMFQDYMQQILELEYVASLDLTEIEKGLAALFKLASEGNPKALAIIKKHAHFLGKAISFSLMMLFIPNIIICGHFGRYGNVLLPPLKEEIEKNLLPNMRVNLCYEPINSNCYAYGSSLLILERYLDFSISREETERHNIINKIQCTEESDLEL